ncbi:MAG: tetratricopeptide repeat protein [Candidatus Binatia bacterium]
MKRDKLRFAGVESFLFSLGALSFLLAVSGCVTAQGYVEAGRRDLLFGDPNRAVVNFQQAAELAPDRLHFSVLPEGAWTYLGRAYYQTGRLPEARQALERGASLSKHDHLARLYLGLVKLREGDRQRGVGDLESGLRGIHEWLDYIESRRKNSYGLFWDPSKHIRGKIKSELAMISRGAAPQELIAGGEWVGMRIEQEIDEARRDESDERSRDGDSRSGERP